MAKHIIHQTFIHEDSLQKRLFANDEWNESTDIFHRPFKSAEFATESRIFDIIQHFFRTLNRCVSDISSTLSDTHESGLSQYIEQNYKSVLSQETEQNTELLYAEAWEDPNRQRDLAFFQDNYPAIWIECSNWYWELVSYLEDLENPNMLVQEFIDHISKPQSFDDSYLFHSLEKFAHFGQNISQYLFEMYDLLEYVRDTTPNHEDYAFYPVVCELLSWERDYRFDIRRRIEQLSWVISRINDEQFHLVQSNRVLQERVEVIETNTNWGGTAKLFAKEFNRNEDTMRRHMWRAHKEDILRCAIEVAPDEVEKFRQYMAQPGKLRKRKNG